MKEIKDLTIEEARARLAEADELRKVLDGAPAPATGGHPWVGEAVFIRTVTYHYTGKVASVTADEIVLVDAAWVADDGRFADALRAGELNEVEPYPDGSEVRINRSSVVDWTTWGHALPREQK